MPDHAVAAIGRIFDAIETEGLAPVWIALADRAAAVHRARDVDPALPLAGVPFAVKDNIDVAGLPTTAGCPAYSYVPDRTATVVQRLLDAGAVLIGKTNLDQFATGLVGVRSPFGACSSVFDHRYISGGSSSGSAVAVAKGLVAFALGTDTAGSGRVPAAFNDIVGLKPTRGLLSTAGVVPACRSLDCVSIFAGSAAGAERVWRVAQGFDAADPFSRTADPGAGAAPWLPGPFRFGVPRDEELAFFGDAESPRLYQTAVARLQAIGGTQVTIDFAPFREAAALLYSGPWVAERHAAIGAFADAHPDAMHPIVGQIIGGAASKTAADAYRGLYRLEELKRAAAAQWARIDVMLLPTAGTIYTKEAVAADPIQLNTNLGYYTNFVNLMDLAAVAVPAGFRRDGLPFGVSLIGPAFSDAALLALASRFAGAPAQPTREAPGCIHVAVVGAHLTGQPLNAQLTERGARLVQSCRTSPEYRFYALANTTPAKPGLVREPGFDGPGIALEVWAVPSHHFGSFVAGVPPPLGIGSVQLDTGEWVKGFICEPAALAGATEITGFGAWKSYLALSATG
ncbi:MAG TPA: allophanate hydrolase [Vicinamibacterales bacterium]|jgi:allophanate hydrolase|nr:allophanate hydrolase [Vicinamibacterales bacterium]